LDRKKLLSQDAQRAALWCTQASVPWVAAVPCSQLQMFALHVMSKVVEPESLWCIPGEQVLHGEHACEPAFVLKYPCTQAVHTRFDDALGAAISNMPCVQTRMARHTRSANAFGAA
jgi:hypothetical protein